MSAGTEQHLPYRSTADVVVLDGDGSRWVRERGEAYALRIPYRLGTDNYCAYGNDDGFVHMGDTIEVVEDAYNGQLSYVGELLSVEYGNDGFISFVSVVDPSNENGYVNVACEGVFFKPEKGADE